MIALQPEFTKVALLVPMAFLAILLLGIPTCHVMVPTHKDSDIFNLKDSFGFINDLRFMIS